MCVRSLYRRAFSTAVPARRASSSASSTSAAVKRRGDSALMRLSAPTFVPAALIGTTSPARIPTLCSSSRCSSSCAAAASISSVTSLASCDTPSRMTCALPVKASAARRIALADPARERDLVGVDVGDRDRADEAAPVGHAHGAPVGELGDRKLGDLLERRLVVQRRCQQLAGAGEQALGHLRALDLGDVLDDVDDELDLAVAVVDAGGLDDPPALLAGHAVDRARDERPGLFAGKDLAAGELVHAQRRAVLVGRLEAVDEGLHGRREQLLRGVVAEHARGGVVGVDERALGVLDGDGFGERREGDGELGLDRLELGEQAGVVEREAGAAGEDLRELEVFGAEAPARVRRDDERQRPDAPAAGSQGDDDERGRAQPAQQLEILGAGGHVDKQRVGDLFDEPRLLGVGWVVDGPRRAFGELAGDLVIVSGRAPGDAHREALELAPADRVDDADVGGDRHDEVVEALDGVLEAARPVGDLGDGSEQREALAVAVDLRAPARGHDGERGHRGHDEDPLEVAEGAGVPPERARQGERDRDGADDDDVARRADDAGDQRREQDDPDDRRRRHRDDVDDGERRRDRQSGSERQHAAAWQPAESRRRRRHLAIIRTAREPRSTFRARRCGRLWIAPHTASAPREARVTTRPRQARRPRSLPQPRAPPPRRRAPRRGMRQRGLRGRRRCRGGRCRAAVRGRRVSV